MRKEKLKDIGDFYTGLSGKSKEDFVNGNALFVTYSNIFNNPVLNLDINDTVLVLEGEKQNEVKCGDVLFTGSSETPDEAGMSSVILSEPKEKMYLNSFCFGYRLKQPCDILPSYMGYILRSKNIRLKITKTAFGVTRFNINKTRFAEIEIPIPPIEEQQKIVSVLDSFTTLIDKMKSEVEKRKKQMEYYREKLFSFEEGECEWMTLGDIGEVRMCKRILKSQTSNTGEIPFYKIGTFGNIPDAYIKKDVFEEYRQKYNYPKVGDILISAAGTIGRCVVFDGTPSYFQDSNIVWIENNEEHVLNKYLRVFYKIAKWKIDDGGVVKRLYNDNLKATPIPVPSLDKQEEIFSKLDKFETYISKLETLIVLRQKQYEYYREKLLTFE